MTSKKAVAAKRAIIPRDARRTKDFLTDWERLNRSGRFDMMLLKAVMMQLIENETGLPPERKDHSLEGSWKGFRDCHVHGDFLLIYRLDGKGDKETITFARVGTHADLFK